jgi:hypothetical protein
MFKMQYIFMLRFTVTTPIIFLYWIPQLIFVIDLHIVYCEVTKSLYTHNI